VRFYLLLGVLAAASIAAGTSTSRAEAAGPGAAPEPPSAQSAPPPAESDPIAPRPPPLHAEYAQYGAAITAEMNLDAGAACREKGPSRRFEPCILGSGGGLSVRGGYRSPGPWFFGGAYEFTKMDSSNLYRLGIFQQLRAELRYLPDSGFRAAPYFSSGVGGVAYGNEWGVETGGALISLGAGVEMEISRLAVLGLSVAYRPVLLAGWTDTAGHQRRTAIAQFLGFEFLLEVRTELARR
jgi:hypothetical protein